MNKMKNCIFKVSNQTRRDQIRSLPRRGRLSWTRSPWSMSSVSTAGQEASRRAATSSRSEGGAGAGADAAAPSPTILAHEGAAVGAGWEAVRATDGAGGEMARACRRRISRPARPGGHTREAVGPVRRTGDRVLDWMQARSGEQARRDAVVVGAGPPPPVSFWVGAEMDPGFGSCVQY
jgi:hypothetical protein